MKKTYIEPTTKVYNVKLESLLTTLSVNGTIDSGTADSRDGGSSFFDDDDEY